MAKVLFDASVYIQAWREKRNDLVVSRAWRGAFVYLSAVVGCELLRGARDRAMQGTIKRLWKDLASSRRLILPQAQDWYDAGVVLAKIGAKYSYETIGQTRLVHDTLVALSARRHGITVITLNIADFERIAEFRRFSFLSPHSLGN